MTTPNPHPQKAARKHEDEPPGSMDGLDALEGQFASESERNQWLGHLQRLAGAGLLASGISHNLANLMMPLVGRCELALSAADDDPQRLRETLSKVFGYAQQANEVLKVFLEFVRRDQVSRTAVPIERVVEDTLVLLKPAMQDAGVPVVRRFDSTHVALVDRTRLLQAVVNLVTNALRAVSEARGTTVEVVVRGEREWVILEVRDDGPGIPEHLRDRIFQPFIHRGDGAFYADKREMAPSSLVERTGLGLFITKRLIEEQGGQIEFETETGKGTTFRLRLEPLNGNSPAERSV